MNFLKNATAQINEYVEKRGHRVSSVLLSQIKKGQDLTDRKNFEGHATASCYVLSTDAQKILFIYNNNLDRVLQPGGHCEHTDNAPINTAIRELEEEVGIKKNDYDILDHIPVDIDTHLIPENPHKAEVAHLHHDFRFLFKLKKEVEIVMDLKEVSNYRWTPIENREFVPKNLYDIIKSFALAKNKS